MSVLADIRVNIFYRKIDEDDLQKVTELIMLSTKPTYKYVNGVMVKDLDVVESRFEFTEKGFDTLIDALTKIKDLTEKDIH